MAELLINRPAIDAAMRQIIQALRSTPNVHPMEMLFALAEVAGRTIAMQEGTWILHNEMLDVTAQHMKRTIHTAYLAEGKNPSGLLQ